MYYADSDHGVFLSSELMTKMTQKTKTYCVINYGVSFRNDYPQRGVNVSKIFPQPYFPRRGRLFPLDRGLYFLP